MNRNGSRKRKLMQIHDITGTTVVLFAPGYGVSFFLFNRKSLRRNLDCISATRVQNANVRATWYFRLSDGSVGLGMGSGGPSSASLSISQPRTGPGWPLTLSFIVWISSPGEAIRSLKVNGSKRDPINEHLDDLIARFWDVEEICREIYVFRCFQTKREQTRDRKNQACQITLVQ